MERHSHPRWRTDRKSSKCVHDGEPDCVFDDVRYLIDFITAISGDALWIGPILTVTLAWTRTLDNEFVRPAVPNDRHWSIVRANFRLADHPLGAAG